ncbi:alpha/beta fold hydrolase [Clostridium uliginosum]|uniref:Alpha/beta hydrolase fold n=1 Tax=Clostridium uliginosum TaxID=119641 RepID=A0A1I1PX92_9CLOT|nr:alpha/beta fold hydrolase [Clostridium uliginosum]SFD14514.1 alpha/beta hydrolase fold [Clostridium uliginosum]
MIPSKINFKKGTYQLNDEPNINYQLNRVIMWNGGDLQEIKDVGRKIHTCGDWVREMYSLGEKALSENRIENAIGYFRMTEFFMFNGNSSKMKVYDRAKKLFYEYYSEYFEDGTIKIEHVPYENGKLPVWHAKPTREVKDIILLHGGNDSYVEEFLFTVLYCVEQGYEVYAFEGPGQGEVLRKYNMPFIVEWELPVKAILDYYNLSDVTIIGVSLGGMFAPRAAAFEKRIKRVVAWSIFPNFLDVVLGTQSPKLQKIVRFLLKNKQKAIINCAFNRLMAKDELVKWGLNHAFDSYGVKNAYEYLVRCNDFQMINIANKINQDFLLLGAKNDHFIDRNLYKEEIDSLTNVKSLTFRLFTDKEEADNHCNVSNCKLSLDTVLNWIEQIKK